MTAHAQAKKYVSSLADRLVRVDLMEFFTDVHKQFYSQVDIQFMEYFLSIAEHEDEFVVHHSKLREYGVMTSKNTSRVGDKLRLLGLTEGVDFTLEDILQRGNTGAQTHRHYHLTPDAFKTCLIRAKRSPGQPVDPIIYSNYYRLLEKVFGLYRGYQAAYQEKVIAMKDEKIDSLINEVKGMKAFSIEQSTKMDEQSAKMDEQSAKIDEQSQQINELLGYSKETKSSLEEVQDDLAETKEEVQIAKSYLEERSLTSTMNPVDENKHHYFGATKSTDGDGSIVVKFVTGQKAYVDATIQRVTQDDHEIAVSPFYNANGIDLRQNVFTEFNKRRVDILARVNEERKIKTEELRAEIVAHNRAHPSQRRSFHVEKSAFRRVGKKDITVTFKKLSFKYTANDFMSFEEVVQVIKDVNGLTQSSPFP